MAIPVYVQSVTTYPGRTEWSDTTDYVVGDRVYFSDSISTNSVYVCIQDHSISGGGTAQQPDVTPNYWQPAGSKEYPFMSGNDGELAKADYNASELTLRATNEFNPQWDPARTLSVSDGSTRAHVILMDGTFNLAHNEYYSLLDTDFFAENFQKSWLLFRYYDSNTTTPERSPSLNNLKIGLHNPKVSFESPIILNSCLISDSSPYSTRTSFKITHRFQYVKFTQAKDCLFDFSMCRNNNFMYTPTTSSVHGQSFLKNTTVILGGQETQYGGIFYQASNLIVDECIFYIKGLVDLPTPLVAGSIAPKMTNSCVFGESFAGTDYFGTINNNLNIGQVDDSNLLNVDPQFIDLENRDYRLRPSSPLIGGAGSKDKRSKIESQYPQGKWFDSSAAAGGDGTWDTPYNNYGEAINSFTGDEAVVLVKEGQHQLFSGCPDSSGAFSYTNDLLKVYSNGIKFIGMGSGSVFDTSSTGINNYGAFWSSAASNPNSQNTPFLFKDLDILLNNTGFINRGMICCRRAEYINVNVTQAPNLGAINSQLFDYTTSSGSGDSGEYLKMSGCTINVSMSNNTSNTSFLVGQSGGLKQFSNCTFADLHRTTSLLDIGSPYGFIHQNFGSYAGSYIKDCIFYSKNPTTVHFGTASNSGAAQGSTNLEVKNCVVFSTQGSVSIGSNYGDGIKELDPKFVATEPHDFDLRLRADSPAIGGLNNSKYPADVIWVQPGTGTGTGTEYDAFYWSQYADAFLATVQSNSKQLVFKDGTYPWSSAILRDDNVGNNITMLAENMHQAIFSDTYMAPPYGRLSSGGNFPTLRFKGIKLLAVDHFTLSQECHYIFDSVHFLCQKYMSALSITAKNCIFEVAPGSSTFIFSNTGTVDIANSIFVDHNDRAPAVNYLTGAQSGIIKNSIFYTKYPRERCINILHNAVLVNCASENITGSEGGRSFIDNLQFVDIENKNYNLRPLSPLIGQGR